MFRGLYWEFRKKYNLFHKENIHKYIHINTQAEQNSLRTVSNMIIGMVCISQGVRLRMKKKKFKSNVSFFIEITGIPKWNLNSQLDSGVSVMTSGAFSLPLGWFIIFCVLLFHFQTTYCNLMDPQHPRPTFSQYIVWKRQIFLPLVFLEELQLSTAGWDALSQAC